MSVSSKMWAKCCFKCQQIVIGDAEREGAPARLTCVVTSLAAGVGVRRRRRASLRRAEEEQQQQQRRAVQQQQRGRCAGADQRRAAVGQRAQRGEFPPPSSRATLAALEHALPEEGREGDERVLGERPAVEGAAPVRGADGEQSPEEGLQLAAPDDRHALRRPQLARRERDRRHLWSIYPSHGEIQVPESPVSPQKQPLAVFAQADSDLVLVVSGRARTTSHPTRDADHLIKIYWMRQSWRIRGVR